MRAALWIFALTLPAAYFAAALWHEARLEAAARLQAETLLAALDTNASVSIEEYAAWKQLAASDPAVRAEALKLASTQTYAPLLRNSANLLGRMAVAADPDGEVSRQLAEELVCAPLDGAPSTANDDPPWYLVPWLNADGLGSEYCARVLTSRLVAAEPGSFRDGAALLAGILAALPPEQARPYIARLLEQAEVVGAGGMDVLMSALVRIDSNEFPAEFTRARDVLATRIANEASGSALASLFDAIDSLKYSVTTEELTPVIDTGLDQMLVRNDVDLTRDMYFTLADLKSSHPDTSFGRRADRLMRGINIYSDALEIYDYSNVLRLEERYEGQDAELARALLEAIRGLDSPQYLSSILPYCERFLDASTALEHAEFVAGAELLFAQLENPAFIFQRPCLLDSGLIGRLAPDDQEAMANLVADAVTNMRGPGAATRIAEGIELLDRLSADLADTQLAALAKSLLTNVGAETSPYGRQKIVGAAAAAGLDFSPEFYLELFVLSANQAGPSSSGITSDLFGHLPEAQRIYLVDAAIAGLSGADTAPDLLILQADLLSVAREWLGPDDKARAITVLSARLESPDTIPVYSRLVRALTNLNPPPARPPANLQQAWLQHVANSTTGTSRADLAELFDAARPLDAIRSANEQDRAAVRAAAVRFLEVIVPGDERAGAVNRILVKPVAAQPPATQSPARQSVPRSKEEALEQDRRRTRSGLRRNNDPTRLSLEPDDVARLAARYVRAIANERLSHPVQDYAVSLDLLARYSRPGELDDVLRALRQRLDASGDEASHQMLVSSWISVEGATNAEREVTERIPLYQELLFLPLTNADSRAALTAAAGVVADQEFADAWSLLKWAPAAVPAR
ncbi:MAG: hypothetical protein ACO1PZ_14440 [Gammaproteobacteria bacterium]